MNVFSMQPSDMVRLLQGRNARLAMGLMNLLLVIWIAAQLASVTWSLLPPPQPAPVVLQASGQSGTPVRKNPHDELINQLPGLHLMGVPAVIAPVAAQAPVDAPDTQLRLTLRGALSSDDRNEAHAIIADSDGREEQYRIGDTVPGNAVLSEVYPDRVLLQRNGRYETLRLPEEGVQTGAATAFARNAPAAIARGATTSPAERLRQLRSQLQTSPKTLFGIIHTSAQYGDDGNIVGYSVSPGSDPQLFAQLGLQDGDVVTEVNSLNLADPQNGARALQSLQSGEPVTVKVLRGGQEQVLSLDIR